MAYHILFTLRSSACDAVAVAGTRGEILAGVGGESGNNGAGARILPSIFGWGRRHNYHCRAFSNAKFS